MDEVLAVLRKEQVSSLEDLQLLSEQPHFTQCFAAITVVKISRALLAQAEPGAHPPKRPLLLEECEAAAVLRAREDERLRGQLLRTREDERREQLLDAMWLATWGAWLATTLQRAWRGRRARHAAERAAADAAAAASFVRRWCFVQLRPEIMVHTELFWQCVCNVLLPPPTSTIAAAAPAPAPAPPAPIALDAAALDAATLDAAALDASLDQLDALDVNDGGDLAAECSLEFGPHAFTIQCAERRRRRAALRRALLTASAPRVQAAARGRSVRRRLAVLRAICPVPTDGLYIRRVYGERRAYTHCGWLSTHDFALCSRSTSLPLSPKEVLTRISPPPHPTPRPSSTAAAAIPDGPQLRAHVSAALLALGIGR